MSSRCHVLGITLCSIAILLVCLLGADRVQAQGISFGSSGLAGESSTNPTSLQFGPDGRLYVAQVNGLVKSYVVARNAANDYVVTGTETITLIQGIPNHNDDGTAAAGETERQITGILVAGTATNPVLYVSSSDPRIGAGGGGNDLGLDTNSGIVSRLTCAGGLAPDGASCLQWEMVHLVRGLPRSEENHAVNGLQLSPDGNTLYLAVGGHTNAGGPSNNFAFTTEYALSAAVLAIDLPAIEALGIKTDSEGQQYYYDLPTLDDPTRPNANGIDDPSTPGYDGVDPGDPWGGNDGLNQAKVIPGGPVSLYATGFRNLYDIVLTESGRMYGVDNGANGNWGGYPEYEESYDCTNNALPGEPGSTGDGPDPATYPPGIQLHDGLNGTVASDGSADAKVNNKNGLHLIPQGYYGGHPTPIRGNPAGAGLYYNGTFFAAGSPNLPADWPPVPASVANPIECDFQNSGVDDGALANYGPSTNGITEYTASNFSGALQGNLLMAGFKNTAPIYRATLNASGDVVTNCTGSQGVPANCGETLFEGFGSQPLDVVAQGDADPFPGTVWAATYGADFITVFEPADYDGGNVPTCDGTYDDTIDEDADGYTNADEIDNSTDPCSAGSQPADNDGTLAADGFKDSDLNDPDDDDDSVADVDDAFAIDNTNGTTTSLPIVYNLFNETPGVNVSFFGLGFTGFMTNGSTDYLNQFIDSDVDDPCAIVAGGTAGLLTYCATAGDAFGGTNSQDNGLQFGIDVDAQTGPFTVRSQINSPFFDGVNPADFQSQGIYLGTGDQDNYLKLVLRGSGGVNGLQVLLENAGVTTLNNYTVPDILLADGIELLFKADPVAGTVQPAYALDDGITIDLGGPIPLSGDLLAALQGTYEIAPGVPSALAVGTIATSRGGAGFSATWDFFTVDYGPNTSPGQWAFVADFDETRHENAFVQAGGKFYLLGGRESQIPRIYDINTQTWSSGAELPSGTGWPNKLHHFQAVELDGLIYAVGAMTGGCCAEPPAERVYVYDPVGDAWMQGAEIPVDRRRGGGGAVVHDGKIYLVSGNTNGHSGPVSPFFDEFDPYTGQWTSLPDVPNPRDHFFAVVHEGKLYAIAGRDSNQSEDGNIFDDVVPEVDVYDFATGAWTTLPPGANIPTPRAAAATGILGGEIIVAGGESNTTAHDVTEAFDPDTYSWRTLSTMLGPRHGTQGIINNGGLYVAGGSPTKGGPGSAILDLEAFYADGVTTPTGTALVASTLGAPDTLNFGQVAAPQTSTLPLLVTNSGGDQAIVIESMSLSGSAAFALSTPFNGPLTLAPGTSFSLDVDFTPPSDQAEAGTLSITYRGGSVLEVALSGNSSDDPPPSAVLYRVNAGGTIVAASDSGPDWGTDTDASPSPYLATDADRTNGFSVDGLHPSVPAGTPSSIFETERLDKSGLGSDMRWSFPTGNGDFVLRFYVMNGWGGVSSPGQRVFDVNVEGGASEVVGLDPTAEFGFRIGGVVEIPVTVTDGSLDVDLVPVVQNPIVNALEVLIASPTGPSATADPAVDQTLRVDYAKGWNLVALPLTAVAPADGATFTNGVETLTFGSSGHYEPSAYSDLNSGEGFWLKMDEAESRILTGKRLDRLSISLREGWNLISSGSCMISAQTVYGNAGVIPNTLFAYEGAYELAAQLAPGAAYWVKANEAMTLNLSCGERQHEDVKTSTRSTSRGTGAAISGTLEHSHEANRDLYNFASLTIGDGAGQSRVLYFGSTLPKESVSGERFVLPPLPPVGAFDVRLAGDASLVESNEAIVQTQVADYPLSLELGGLIEPGIEYEVEVVVDGARSATYSLAAGKALVFEEHGITSLHVRSKNETVVPSAFALTGVYPNPVIDQANIAFDLPEQADVKLELYDVLGRLVHRVDEPTMAAGANQTLRLRTVSLATGAYFFRLIATMPSQTQTETGRITIVR